MTVRHLWIIIATGMLVSACGGSGGNEEFRAPTPNINPTADFTVTPTSGKEPLLGVGFDATRSNDPDGVVDAYSWDFGDGTSGAGRTVSHDYPAAGDYTVSLVVTDNDGGASTNLSTASITVSANVLPVALFDFSPLADQPSPAIITFDASTSSDSDGVIAQYDWDFGDGGADSGSVVSHTFENTDIVPIVFPVTLTVTDDTGDVSIVSQDVTVLPINMAPVADFTACPIAACAMPDDPPFFAPYTVTFDASVSSDIDGAIVQYEWDFDDGNSVVNDDDTAPDFLTASNEYVTSGTFSVSLTVTDEFGASDSITVDVIIDNLPPTALVTAVPTQGRAPLDVFFDASASLDSDGTISEYQWYYGDGQSGSAQVDPDTGAIVAATLVGVGGGNGITADHVFSNIGSLLGTRGFAAAETVSIAAGDVDGNGVVDIVVGNFLKANHLFLNVSSTNPLQAQSSIDIGTDLDATLDIALADLNGDGFDDLVTVNGTVNADSSFVGQENKVYLWNDANGSFDAALSVSLTDIDASTSVAVGNVNNDAFPDLVVGNQGAVNRIYFGDGSGLFAIAADVGTDTGDTADVLLEDVDADGDLDVIAANANGINRLYLGNVLGVFAFGSDIGVESDESTSLAISDIDGDGDPDLVVGNAGENTSGINRYYLNQCDGACAADTDVFAGVVGVDITEDSETTAAVALEDLDGDGDIDLLVGNILQPSRIYLNYRNAAPFDSILFNDSIVADPNCDPDPDPDVCDCKQSAPTSTACMTVPVTSGEFLFTGRTSSLVTIDLTEDSSPDLIAGDFGTENRSFLSTCNGACTDRDTNPFVGAFPMSFPANNTAGMSVGDVDGDGDLDLVAAVSIGPNQLLLSAPEAGFGLTSYLATSSTDSSRAVELADMDGDGDLDLVVGNAGQVNRYYANTCNGVCVPDEALFDDGNFVFDISSDLANTGSVAVGDVDGDGDLDLVAGNGVFSDQPNRVFMNLCVEFDPVNGCPADVNVFDPNPGSLIVPPLFFDVGDDPLVPGDPVDLHNTQSIALVDLDLDGDLDLVVGNNNQVNFYYINTCNGACVAGDNPFTLDGVALDVNTPFHTQAVHVADVDNDGDGDLIIGNAGEANRYFLNEVIPTGIFSLQPGVDIGPAGDATFAIATGDLDGDGGLDIVAGNDGANRVYYNLPGDGYFSSNSVGLEIASDQDSTRAVLIVDVGDIGSDAQPDLVVGNSVSQNIINYNFGVHIVILRVIDNAGDAAEMAIPVEAQSQ